MRTGNLALFLASALLFEAQARSETTISGPYSHDNLSIFLIHRSRPGPAGRYLTLQQAMEQKKVTVHETARVNDLAVENTSSESVFLQAGDIVRGGNQDRMISNDFVLPPKSGRIPLAVFCVEQGRWRQRGSESANTFAASTELGAVRFEPKSMWSQASIWAEVRKMQERLVSGIRKNNPTGLAAIQAEASPTSLVLTQTSRPVEDAVSPYTKRLATVIEKKAGVVGYAFAVNGDIKGADLYASPELFTAMWPKLLKSSVIEAVALREQSRGAAPRTASAVEQFLREADAGKQTTTIVNPRVKLIKRESQGQTLVESWEGPNWVHRSVLKKAAD